MVLVVTPEYLRVLWMYLGLREEMLKEDVLNETEKEIHGE